MHSSLAFVAQPIDWNPEGISWSMTPQTGTTASFSVESVTVDVNFERREPAVWFVSFTTPESECQQALLLVVHIFNGVMAAVHEFLKLWEPNILVFPASQ